MLRVRAADWPTEDLVAAVQRLLPQLSSSARLPSRAEVEQIVMSPATTLLVASDESLETMERLGVSRPEADGEELNGPIVGMLTLVTFRIPTGVRAWVEDVVVDAAARGRGVGEMLVRAAVELAGDRGAHTVDLTSRSSRLAANRLYERVGFQLRQTNVWRRELRR